MNSKEKLKKEIRDRAGMIVSDCNTFLMARSNDPTKISEWKTGSGNFLMAVGLFSVLNFLSKTYRLLTEPEAFVTDHDIEEVKKLIEKLKNDPDFNRIQNIDKIKWRSKRKGEVNETDSFVKFVEASQKNIDLGFPRDGGKTAREAWVCFRNSLTHMAYPNRSIGTYPGLKSNSLQEIIFTIKIGKKSFYLNKKEYICNSDKLTVDVYDLSEWLCNKVDRFDTKVVKSTLEWING